MTVYEDARHEYEFVGSPTETGAGDVDWPCVFVWLAMLTLNFTFWAGVVYAGIAAWA
jgi:hypothetical protein